MIMRDFKETKITIITLVITGGAALFGCTPSTTQTGTAAPTPAPTPTPFTLNCIGLGCATSSGTPYPTQAPVGPGGNVSNPAIPTPTPLATGASGQLTITNQNTFNTYVGAPLNNPSLIQINIQLAPTSDSPQVFLGGLHIRYHDAQPSGQLILHDGHFTNGTVSSHGNNVSILTSNNGIPTYRIFLEDPAGAIVLLLSNSGGGAGSDTGGQLSGQVYFHNFNSSAPNPLFNTYYAVTPYCNYGSDPSCTIYGGYYYAIFPSSPYAFCWAGEGNGPVQGPYDCRNFSVPPTSSGNAPFTLLGTVTNLNLNSALGI
jgi:hypothetical protein